MKNKKLILSLVISILGIILVCYGVINYLNNNKINNNNNNNKNSEISEKKSISTDFNESKDLEGLEKKLIIVDFKYNNSNNKCNFEFSIINNYDEDIDNKLLKVNFYDKNKKLLNTFDYFIVHLGVHSITNIKYNIETKGEASIFDYEFNDEKISINVKE